MDSKSHWDALHENPRFRPVYPDDRVVAWVFRNFPKDTARAYRILDIGCGAGRHSLFLAENGYIASACDFSKVALSELKKRAVFASSKIDTVFCEAISLDFADESFDGVLCIGVLYYLPYRDFVKAVAEIYRVMKSGAKAMIVIRSITDSRCKNSVKVGENTCRLRNLPRNAPSDAKNGMTMTFLTKKGVMKVFKRFPNIEINRITIEESDGKFTNVDWQVLLRK